MMPYGPNYLHRNTVSQNIQRIPCAIGSQIRTDPGNTVILYRDHTAQETCCHSPPTMPQWGDFFDLKVAVEQSLLPS